MRKSLSSLAVLALAGAGLVVAADPPQSRTAGEPDHIQVQHILVSFAGKLPGKKVTRTQQEARKLAYEILERARKGEDFDALVKAYTDDSHPGIYGMANRGVTPASGEYPRRGMVPAFGDVGFGLKVGEIGIADFDASRSPYGYHIIKRIR